MFENHESSKEDVTRAGEEFFLKLYGARTVQTLDKHRYTCHATTVPYVDLHCRPHLSWSLFPQQMQQQDNTPCEPISLCNSGKGIS